MLDIAKQYEQQWGGFHYGIRRFVEDLMAGDPSIFKSGYSRENAIIAAAEAFDVSRDAVLRHLEEQPPYTVAHTVDEFGEDRWFVEDEHADWIGEPFPTREMAAEEAQRLNNEKR